MDDVEACRHRVNSAIKVIDDMDANKQHWLEWTSRLKARLARHDTYIQPHSFTVCSTNELLIAKFLVANFIITEYPFDMMVHGLLIKLTVSVEIIVMNAL